MKWRVVAVLTILLIAIVLAAIIIAILNAGGTVNEFEGGPAGQRPSGHRYGDPDFDSLKTTKNSHMGGASRFVNLSTLATTLLPIAKVTVDIQEPIACDSDQIWSSCPRPSQQIRRKIKDDSSDDLTTLFNVTKPIEYALNVSITDRSEKRLKGKIVIWVNVVRETDQLLLQAGSNVQILEEHLVSVLSCEDEIATLVCVNSMTRFVDDNHILLSLSRPIAARGLVRVAINRFETVLTSGTAGLLLQQPQKWERDRAWIVGTLNSARSPSASSPLIHYFANVFPLIANDGDQKSTFKLCIEHPKNAVVKSNMPKRMSTDLPNHLVSTCFRKTSKISLDSFSFVIFDNLQLISSSGGKPEVEAFIGKYLNPSESQWIVDEARQILEKMAEITRVKYPLEKLTLLSSPLSAFDDGAAALGLVHMKETWVEHPKYAFTHNVLIAQLVRQWLANTVTFCDKCFQDGVATYLEWRLSAELESRVAAADEFSTNATRRFVEARNRFLYAGSVPTAAKFTIGSLKPANDCADRIAVILFTLENAYSYTSVKNFISLTVRENAWTDCIPDSRLPELFSQVTGRSDIARQVFETFVGDNSSKSPPLVFIKVNGGILTVSQEKNDTIAPKAIPIQITDDSQHQTQIILTTSEVTSERPIKFVVADPNSYVRHLYNPENYENILNCYDRNCAALSYDAFNNAISDLCWALLSNKIDADPATKPNWSRLFHSLSSYKRDIIYDSNCMCCLQGRANVKAQCRWTWRDTCSKIDVLK